MASVHLLDAGIAEWLRMVGWAILALSLLSAGLIFYFVSNIPARICFLFATFLVFVVSIVFLLAGL